MFEASCLIAYVGPGAGLSMIGALLAVIALFLFALLAPVLYVIRLVRSIFLRSRTQDSMAVPPQAGQK